MGIHRHEYIALDTNFHLLRSIYIVRSAASVTTLIAPATGFVSGGTIQSLLTALKAPEEERKSGEDPYALNPPCTRYGLPLCPLDHHLPSLRLPPLDVSKSELYHQV